jgi:tRNA U34 2-thiouridine synthase MnmA/TrmU
MQSRIKAEAVVRNDCIVIDILNCAWMQHDVEGVYMRNWDVADETGYCSADQDYADMQSVCKYVRVRYTAVSHC